ncbi:MAG: hypothetical protein ACPGN3_10800 [Opitutales bacterium]
MVAFFEIKDGDKRLVTYDAEFEKRVIPQKSNSDFRNLKLFRKGVMSFEYSTTHVKLNPYRFRRQTYEKNNYVINIRDPKMIIPGKDYLLDPNLNHQWYLINGNVFGVVVLNSEDGKVFEKPVQVPYLFDPLQEDFEFLTNERVTWVDKWIPSFDGKSAIGFSNERTDSRAVIVSEGRAEIMDLPNDTKPVFIGKNQQIYALHYFDAFQAYFIQLSSDGSEIGTVLHDKPVYDSTSPRSWAFDILSNPMRILYSEKYDEIIHFGVNTSDSKELIVASKAYRETAEFVKKQTFSTSALLVDFSEDENKLLYKIRSQSGRVGLALMDVAQSTVKILEGFEELSLALIDIELNEDLLPWRKYNVEIPLISSLSPEDKPLVIDIGGNRTISTEGKPNREIGPAAMFRLAGYDYLAVLPPGVKGYGADYRELGKKGFFGAYEEMFYELAAYLRNDPRFKNRRKVLILNGLYFPAGLDYLIDNPDTFDFCFSVSPFFNARQAGVHRTPYAGHFGIPFGQQGEWIGDVDNRNSKFSDIKVMGNIRKLDVPTRGYFLSEDSLGFDTAKSYSRKNKKSISLDTLYEEKEDVETRKVTVMGEMTLTRNQNLIFIESILNQLIEIREGDFQLSSR